MRPHITKVRKYSAEGYLDDVIEDVLLYALGYISQPDAVIPLYAEYTCQWDDDILMVELEDLLAMNHRGEYISIYNLVDLSDINSICEQIEESVDYGAMLEDKISTLTDYYYDRQKDS